MKSVQSNAFSPKGSHTESSALSSATTIVNPGDCDAVIVQAFVQNIRYTLDGSAPDLDTGFQLKAGDPPLSIPCRYCTVKVIEEAATAKLQYQKVTNY
jgi:hypothetical protein